MRVEIVMAGRWRTGELAQWVNRLCKQTQRLELDPQNLYFFFRKRLELVVHTYKLAPSKVGRSRYVEPMANLTGLFGPVTSQWEALSQGNKAESDRTGHLIFSFGLSESTYTYMYIHTHTKKEKRTTIHTIHRPEEKNQTFKKNGKVKWKMDFISPLQLHS